MVQLETFGEQMNALLPGFSVVRKVEGVDARMGPKPLCKIYGVGAGQALEIPGSIVYSFGSDMFMVVPEP